MVPSSDEKQVIVFAGPNGSGKSTARDPVLVDFKGQYINADEIAASLNTQITDYTERNVFAANVAEQQRKECLKKGESFAYETVMSTPEKVAIMSQARSLGFEVSLFFVSTVDPAINVARVASRVEQGGHNVDEDKIRSRYASTMALLPSAIDQSHNVVIYDNSAMVLQLVATKLGLHAELKIESALGNPDWGRVDLAKSMQDRTLSLASLSRVLRQNHVDAPPVSLANAAHGQHYSGTIIAATHLHALQEIKIAGADKSSFVVHDLALTQQKQLLPGANAVVSYEYKFGKVVSAALEHNKSNQIQRDRT